MNLLGTYQKTTVKNIITFLQNNSFETGFDYLQKNIKQNLWNILALIEAMTPLIVNDKDIPIKQKVHIIDVFSKIENRLSTGKNGVIYIAMVVSAFK